jgi:hypothetical protein
MPDTLALPINPFAAPVYGAPLSHEKVEAYKTRLDILQLPLICVGGSDTEFPLLIDGHHRIIALKENGATEFVAYVVSSEDEVAFRIPSSLLEGALTFLRSAHHAADSLLHGHGWHPVQSS